MIHIYYKKGQGVDVISDVNGLNEIAKSNVVWVDLSSPSGDEKRSVEAFLGTTLQSKAQAEEIESSSRYFESNNVIFINTNFLMPGPEEYIMEAVSFILYEKTIVSVRNVPLRSFEDINRKIRVYPQLYPTGYHVLAGILENRIDLDADMIEIMAKEVDSFSRKITAGEDVNQDFLIDINQLQENTMTVRENIVDKQRMVNSILKNPHSPRELSSKLVILSKDIVSLINHTDFAFERLDYLQNTVLGLINLEQNKIMKVFTVVSLLLMPPTLIASIYGMNIKLPIFGNDYDFPILVIIMLSVIFCTVIVFWKKNMLK